MPPRCHASARLAVVKATPVVIRRPVSGRASTATVSTVIGRNREVGAASRTRGAGGTNASERCARRGWRCGCGRGGSAGPSAQVAVVVARVVPGVDPGGVPGVGSGIVVGRAPPELERMQIGGQR